MAKPLDNYVEVSERIELFYKKFPEGSLRCKEIRSVEINGEHFLVYVAQAFRHPDDQAPAEGAAWEPVPGKTNFTRDSELMNAETSAWGRAIAALGFEVKRGIASRQEVQNRRGSEGNGQAAKPTGIGFATYKQKTYFERLLKDAGASANTLNGVVPYMESLPSQEVSETITGLKENPKQTGKTLALAANEWAKGQSDIPGDTQGLEPVEVYPEDIPF